MTLGCSTCCLDPCDMPSLPIPYADSVLYMLLGAISEMHLLVDRLA